MKLADICEINPKAEVLDDNTLISFVAMPDVSEDGRINVSTHRTYGEVKKGFTNFKEGDVLFAKITPCMENGKGALATGLKNRIGFGSTEFHVLRPNTAIVLGQWLYYLTSWSAFRKDAEKHMTGSAGQKRVPKSFLEKYEVAVPPIDDQKHQVLQLNQIQKIIDARQQQLSALDDLIKARFVEMFGDPVSNPKGWERARFDSLCENLDYRRIPITSTDRISGIYPYYGASGIVDYVDDYIFDEDILLISEDGANLVMRSTPIAFSVTGKVWVNNHAHVVRFKEMATQKYIETAFSFIDISEHITGSAQPKFNQAKLNAMMFNNPPLKLQKQFADFVTQIDKSKVVVQKALNEAQLLFDSLMQQYFG